MPKPDKFNSPFGKPNAPGAAKPRPVEPTKYMGPHGYYFWFDELVDMLQPPTIPKIVGYLKERAEQIRAADAARHAAQRAASHMQRSYGAGW